MKVDSSLKSDASPVVSSVVHGGYAAHLPLFLFFLALASFTVFRHEMWRDEIECWSIARGSRSLIELFRNIEHEGHPSGWFLVLYLISRLFHSPVAMQVVHLFFGVASAWIVWICAPFDRITRGMLIFGYFILFEYLVICRMYALGVLLLFLFLHERDRRPENIGIQACILFLLAHSSVYGTILSIALAVPLFTPSLIKVLLSGKGWISMLMATLPTVIVLVGWITAALQMMPPSDQGYESGWVTCFDSHRVLMTCSDLWKGYFPLAPWNRHFWGFWDMDNIISSLFAKSVLALLLFATVVVLLRRSPRAVAVYIVGTLGLVALGYFKFVGYQRHYGHYYLLLLASFWTAMSARESNIRMGGSWDLRGRIWFLKLIAFVQIVAVVYPLYADWTCLFSAGKQTAEFISKHGLDNMLIVSDRDWSGITVAGYLDRSLYSPRTGRMNSFVVKDNVWAEWRRWSEEDVLRKVRGLGKKRGDNILLVLDYPLTDEQRGHAISLIWASADALVPDETYHVYIFSGGPNTNGTL